MEVDLIGHQDKCRFCLGEIRSTRHAVQINEEIEQSFFSLTNKEVSNFNLKICILMNKLISA